MAEEFLEYLDGGVAEVSVAEGDEKVVLQTGEYQQPLLQFLILEILLQTRLKYFYMCPF